MPSFASFSKPFAVGQSKERSTAPTLSLRDSFQLPETAHLDTSDFLSSVQSVHFSDSQGLDSRKYNAHVAAGNRLCGQINTTSPMNDSGFSGGHNYKISRMEERRRLRSLGLLNTTQLAPPGQPPVETQKPLPPDPPPSLVPKSENKRRTSWQPPSNGKLQKARNKSKERDVRKSLEQKLSVDYQPPQQSFSRIHDAPPSPLRSDCNSPSPVGTQTPDLMLPRPPFARGAGSGSSLGSIIGVATSMQSTSLGSLVDFYDPGAIAQAYTTAPSSPQLHASSQRSSNTSSPVTGARNSMTASPALSVRNSATASPVVGRSPLASSVPATTPELPQAVTRDSSSDKSSEPTTSTPLPPPPPPPTPATPPVISHNSYTPPKPSSNPSRLSFDETTITKSMPKPYQPRYAAKSHVSSTAPLVMNSDKPAVPSVHLDLRPPAKPFAAGSSEPRRLDSGTRLSTQEAREYSTIAQATRDALRAQSPAIDMVPRSKTPLRSMVASSPLSSSGASASAGPSVDKGKQPIKSILRKSVQTPVQAFDIPSLESNDKMTQQLNALRMSANGGKGNTPSPITVRQSPLRLEKSEPVSPVESSPEPERGRAFQRGESPSGSPLQESNVNNYNPARRSLDITPSAKAFDISKYSQNKSKPASTAQGKPGRAFPPVSYRPPVSELFSNPNGSTNSVSTISAPPIPDFTHANRGLSTPPPIRSVDLNEDRKSASAAPPPSNLKQTMSHAAASGVDRPVRPRAPSMSEILKDLHKFGSEEVESPEPNEATDWLSQLFRSKKSDTSRPSTSSAVANPVPEKSVQQPAKQVKKEKEKESKRSSRSDLAREKRVAEKAERQRHQVERKFQEAEAPPSPVIRSSLSFVPSPDLRKSPMGTPSLRSVSTVSVDRLEHGVNGSPNLSALIANNPDDKLHIEEKNPNRKSYGSTISAHEVRATLGEMTPPHEREDWQSARSTSPLPSPPLLPETSRPSSRPVSARLPLHNYLSPSHSVSTATTTFTKDSFNMSHTDGRSSASSLNSIEPMKQLNKIFVVCCNCQRFHDPPHEVYRRMVNGTSSFKCPYCMHGVNLPECCSSYSAVCNIVEKHH